MSHSGTISEAMVEDLKQRILGALEDYRDREPEDDESWESWHFAAFDLAVEKVRSLFASPSVPTPGTGGITYQPDENTMRRMAGLLPLAAPFQAENLVQCGWAYQDKNWDADRWHVCGFDHKPREHEGRIVRPIYVPALSSSPVGEMDGWQHPDDAAVDRFAVAMKAKLALKREQGRGGWDGPDCTAQILSGLLRNHVEKGDPLDVGNLAMMLHQRGERIS